MAMISSKSVDVAARAKKLYEEKFRIMLEASNRNDFVAVEPDSGRYFIGGTLSEAIQASRAAFPDRLAFVMRVGHQAAVHLASFGSQDPEMPPPCFRRVN